MEKPALPKDTNFAAANPEALLKRGYAHTTEYSFVNKKIIQSWLWHQALIMADFAKDPKALLNRQEL